MKPMSVLFVVPPQEYGYGYINDFFWQEGLLQLTSFLVKRFGDAVTVRICDGNHRSMQECRDVVRAGGFDLIGLHTMADHTRSASIELARLAVETGCRRIVFGGAAAIFGAAPYVESLRDVDEDILVGACTDVGEYTLEAALLDHERSQIPNLIYRSGSGEHARLKRSRVVRGKPSSNEYLDELPFEVYEEIFEYIRLQLERSDYPYQAPTYSGLSHDGCPHRVYREGELIRGCTFCAIPTQKMVARPPDEFWARFARLDTLVRRRFGQPLRSIKDWGDSLTPKLLGRLIQHRPERYRNTSYSGYLSIADMTPTMLDSLQEMGCWSVYMGLDGTSDSSLSFLEKGYSAGKFWDRLELLRSAYDFRIELGIILGSQGETRTTLAHSVEVAQRISAMFTDRVIVLQGNMLVPMPGSFVFHTLRETARERSLTDPMTIDVQARIRMWLENFTSVTFDECALAQSAIEKISPRRHSYSMPRAAEPASS
jgi:hypothetical protein